MDEFAYVLLDRWSTNYLGEWHTYEEAEETYLEYIRADPDGVARLDARPRENPRRHTGVKAAIAVRDAFVQVTRRRRDVDLAEPGLRAKLVEAGGREVAVECQRVGDSLPSHESEARCVDERVRALVVDAQPGPRLGSRAPSSIARPSTAPRQERSRATLIAGPCPARLTKERPRLADDEVRRDEPTRRLARSTTQPPPACRPSRGRNRAIQERAIDEDHASWPSEP